MTLDNTINLLVMQQRIYIMIVVVFFCSCKIVSKDKVLRKENNIENHFLAFQNIIIEGEGRFNISITQCNQNNVRINADDDQLGLISISNNNKFLKILGDNKLRKYRKIIDIDINIDTLKSICLKKKLETSTIFKQNTLTTIKFLNKILGDTLVIIGEGRNKISGDIYFKHFATIRRQLFFHTITQSSSKKAILF